MEIRNKVAESGIITIDLESFFPNEEIIELDIKAMLFQGLLLKEKDFRETLKKTDWSVYANKTVALLCSTDAIIPQWAYMLLTYYLLTVTAKIYFGTKENVECDLLLENINNTDATKYAGQKVVIKGCGTKQIPSGAYVAISKKMIPHVQSLMFGEPCSTVPVYKQKKETL